MKAALSKTLNEVLAQACPLRSHFGARALFTKLRALHYSPYLTFLSCVVLLAQALNSHLLHFF